MDKATVYIENTIVSYLTGRPSRNVVVAAWQEITRDWWEKGMNEIITEVRRVREQIVKEHEGDLHALCAALRKRQAEHPERLVDRSRRIREPAKAS